MPTIGLAMIVRDEAHVIVRCLTSVLPLVDYLLIVDTGSRDGTPDLVRRFLREQDLPGEVVAAPWRNFAHNRSDALAQLRRRADIDYALMIDADEVLIYEDGFDAAAFKAGLQADLYDVKTAMGATVYHRPQLTANRKPFYYKAVLHEYLECDEAFSRADAIGFHNKPIQDGARNRDPQKYLKDAALLQEELRREGDPFLVARYTFYMAQSYRDGGRPEQALAAYRRRATQGFWDQEIYISLLQAARLMEQLGHPVSETLDAYLAAHAALPSRLEALHGAVRLCRLNDRHQQGYDLARQGLAIRPPDKGLFVERAVGDFALLDEFSIIAYWAGHYRDSADACRQLLASPLTPAQHHERIRANLNFALAKLSEQPPHRPLPFDGTDAGRGLAKAGRTPAKPARILLAILAKQGEAVLPFYLECIEALDYPKDAIELYVRTNNNTDATAAILAGWLDRVGRHYAGVEFDHRDVPQNVQQFAVHDWNPLRFSVLAPIRQASLLRTLERGCDFYFTADVDNFIRPHSLRQLVSLDLPIAAPLLRHVDLRHPYSNYHAAVDANGYYRECEEYHWLQQQRVRGINEVPVVHCTYLVRADAIPHLSYSDGSPRHEYVIFSDSARRAGVPQYLDNRDVYGYLTLEEESQRARHLIGAEIRRALRS